MPTLKEKIEGIRTQLLQELTQVQSAQDIQNLRSKYIGKKGLVTALLAELKNLAPDEKRTFGPQLNQLKTFVEAHLKETHESLVQQQATAAAQKKQYFDVTAYRTEQREGHRHPYSQLSEEIENIFLSMGYSIPENYEVESDYYNFGALNIPPDHPARDMYDTFWLTNPGMLLRTHTSTMQVRIMESQKLPIATIVPGRCYRHEATDASHDFMFMQCEGFLIDKKITLSHLFGTAKRFLQALFKKEKLELRIRPGYFPFVEPGVEIDVQCPFCSSGCSVCKKSRWIEVFPGGLIHPNVLKAGNIDPEQYSGFAFGFGLTRLAMIRYGINDIRLLHSSKIRFLEQF